MRIIFIHNNLPSQYRHLINHLSRPDSGHQVVCMTRNAQFRPPGALSILITPEGECSDQTHPYLQGFDGFIREAQTVYRALDGLKQQGFVPDIICSHLGLGPSLYVKDIFPDVPLLSYCEWYVSTQGGEWDFDPNLHVGIDSRMKLRTGNAPLLLDLVACDAGVCPTRWQLSRFPKEFHSKISLLHDGIDTGFFASATAPTGVALPGLSLPAGTELITYVARGMDSVRGFPQFMEAASLLLKRRPKCHIVVVGDEKIAYGPKPPVGDSYKRWMISRLELESSRLHFVGTLSYDQYLKVLQASKVHVYLTTPFVLSWSFMEAMSVGCLMVASDTEPVREVITDGENGLLVDFFDTSAMAGRIGQALDAGEGMRHLRQAARQTIIERYDLRDILPRHLELITGLCRKKGVLL